MAKSFVIHLLKAEQTLCETHYYEAGDSFNIRGLSAG